MDFTIPESVRTILERMEHLLEQHVYPLERAFGEAGFRAIEPKVNEVRALVKREGLWAPQVPKSLGGMGLDLVDHALVSEVLGRSPLGHYVFGCPAPDAGNIELLAKFGTEAQKRDYLMPLIAGEVRSCFSMTEPEFAGSNPTELGTRARSDGDDYVIDGHKWFTSSADGAAFAIVMAVTDPGASPHLRASMILVPTSTPGFKLVRNMSIMGRAGDGYASHAELRYEGVRVPKSNRIGDEGAGFLLAQERLGPGRIQHCMRWLGICERSFRLMAERAATRGMGDGKTLASKQVVQTWIAESRASIDAARLLVLHAAWRIEREGFHGARDAVSLIKFHTAGVMQQVVDRAVQVHGALGLTDDTPLAHFFAHERGARIYHGPDEVHKVVVARRLMARYETAATSK